MEPALEADAPDSARPSRGRAAAGRGAGLAKGHDAAASAGEKWEAAAALVSEGARDLVAPMVAKISAMVARKRLELRGLW